MDRDDEVIERFEADAAYKWKANGEESSERAKSPPSAEAKPELEPQSILAEFRAPAFDIDDVPEAIGDFAVLFAKAAGFCPTATIVPAVVAVAAMIDDDIRVRVPGASNWFESARLWSVGVAGPAAGKTPGMRAMVKPVMDLHRALVDEWSAKNAQLAPEEREPLPALFTNDCTVEKLSDVLRDNPRGLRYPHAHTTIATIWRCVWGRLHARPWARACADNICRHF